MRDAKAFHYKERWDVQIQGTCTCDVLRSGCQRDVQVSVAGSLDILQISVFRISVSLDSSTVVCQPFLDKLYSKNAMIKNVRLSVVVPAV